MMENYKVVEMNVYNKWWDKWFVVADSTINLLLHNYNYFSLSPVYLLTDGDVEKKEFIVRKPRRNLQGSWSKMDIVGVIDDLGGLLPEVQKFCGNDIFFVTDTRVPEEDLVNGQKIFVFFALGTHEKTIEMENFLNKNDFLFLMADDVPFVD